MMSLLRSLYSNRFLLQHQTISRRLILLLLLLSTSIVSAPLMVARSQIDEAVIIERFPGIENVLSDIFLTYDCYVDQRLICADSSSPKQIGEYQIVLFEEPTNSTFVAFLETRVVIRYEEEQFVGGYRFFEGLSFLEISSNLSNSDILYAFATSTTADDFLLIWLIQLIQNSLLFVLLGWMLLFTNYRIKHVNKLAFRSAFSIAVLAYLGPALLGSFVGLVEAGIGGIITVGLYSIRMMYVYFGLFPKQA